jgi:hypothetical protein
MPRYRYMTYKADSGDRDIDGPVSSLSYHPTGAVDDLAIIHPSGKVALTGRGALAIKLTNGCGRASQRGWAVCSHTSSINSYHIATADYNVCGFVYEGVAAGVEGWVVTNGICDVMIGGGAIKTGDAILAWTGSATDGARIGVLSGAQSTQLNPAPSVIGTFDYHMRECGPALETAASSSNYIVKAVVHFN